MMSADNGRLIIAGTDLCRRIAESDLFSGSVRKNCGRVIDSESADEKYQIYFSTRLRQGNTRATLNCLFNIGEHYHFL
jgi:hypothetical protein